VVWLIALATCLAVGPALVEATPTTDLPEANADDGPRYPVMGVAFFYTQPNLPLPAMSNLLRKRITLGQTEGGLVAYREGLPKVRVRLSDLTRISTLPDTFLYASAIRQISQQLLGALNERGFEGFVVAPVPGQFSPEGEDLRGEQLKLKVAVRPVRNDQARAALAGKHPDGNRYPVTEVELRYTEPADWLPDINRLYDIPIRLSETEGGFVAPREGLNTVRMTLRELGRQRDTFFHRSALQQVMETTLEHLNRQGYAGFVIQPAPGQISESGEDVRLSGDTLLTIDIVTTGVRSAGDAVTGVDGMRYPVSDIRIAYAMDRQDMPAPDALLETPVTFADTEDGFTAYREGMVRRNVTLADIPVTDGEDDLFGSAIKAIGTELVERFNQRGYVGVVVQPAEGQFSSSGLDIRPAGDNTLTYKVYPGVVTAVRTTSRGEDGQTRENTAAHQAIRQGSPVQPTEADAEADPQQRDVMKQEEIERYVHWLNRHPGRRVDVAVGAGEGPGRYELDYRVHQQKPWRAFVQSSNTGTDQTADWRQRFGFVHNQLTGADDILRLDYITANFDELHTFMGSYERPLPGMPRLRARVFGSYSEFTASDINVFNQSITGDSYTFGGELAWNVFQHEDFFVDAVGGAQYLNASITDELFDVTGETGFFLPSVGLRAERHRQTDTFHASVGFEWNIEDVGTDEAELADFGRLAIDSDFARLTFDVGGSFYVQPLLDQSISRARPPVDALVHEIALSARGQYVLDDKRIIPQLQQTAGGLHTVRGYEESSTVGDNVVIGTAEYRFHLPRMLSPGETGSLLGREFAYRPSNELARPDWDLILKAFVDAASVNINDRRGFERNEDLVGAGVGVELQLARNLNLRLDWAAALKSVEDDDAGDDRLHFVGTILY